MPSTVTVVDAPDVEVPAYIPPPAFDEPDAPGLVLPNYTPRNPTDYTANELTFTFLRAPHGGWHVFDEGVALRYDVKHTKANPSWVHELFEVFDGEGGDLLVSLLDNKLTAGSFITELTRPGRHNFKYTLLDQQRREFGFKEGDRDRLVIYPSRTVVAEGNVTTSAGSGRLKILDKKNAPEIPVLLAFYCNVLRNQEVARGLGYATAGAAHPAQRISSRSSR